MLPIKRVGAGDLVQHPQGLKLEKCEWEFAALPAIMDGQLFGCNSKLRQLLAVNRGIVLMNLSNGRGASNSSLRCKGLLICHALA
jgi:hypothetical protein